MLLNEAFFISTVSRPTEDEAFRHLMRGSKAGAERQLIIRRIVPPPFELIPLRQSERFRKDISHIKTCLQKNCYWRKTRRGWRGYSEPRAIAAAMVQDGYFWVSIRHVEEALHV